MDPVRQRPIVSLMPLLHQLKKERGFEDRVRIENRRIVITYTFPEFFEMLYGRDFETTAAWDIDTPPIEEASQYFSEETQTAIRSIMSQEMGFEVVADAAEISSIMERCPTGRLILSAWGEFLNGEWRAFLMGEMQQMTDVGGVNPRWFNIERSRNESGEVTGFNVVLDEPDKEFYQTVRSEGLDDTIRRGLDFSTDEDALFASWENGREDQDYMSRIVEDFEPHIADVLSGLYRERYRHNYLQKELGDWNR